jgi:Holliday junction resolvase RusA-like endonuclease
MSGSDCPATACSSQGRNAVLARRVFCVLYSYSRWLGALVAFKTPRYTANSGWIANDKESVPMAMHLEFVVLGPPISNQQSTSNGKANLATWRAIIAGSAGQQWANPLLMGDWKAVIINFHAGSGPSDDVDNMSKPILDEMQHIVYQDDRQITQAEITHLRIGAAFSIAGVSKVLVTALQAGLQFVYVRIEDPVDPFPLPK